MHHKLFFNNYGPDIYDILFDTKYKPNTDIENTDHYLFNNILATIIVLGIKYIWTKNNDNKELIINIYKIMHIICGFIIVLETLVIYFNEIEEKNKQYKLSFDEYMNKISIIICKIK